MSNEMSNEQIPPLDVRDGVVLADMIIRATAVAGLYSDTALVVAQDIVARAAKTADGRLERDFLSNAHRFLTKIAE